MRETVFEGKESGVVADAQVQVLEVVVADATLARVAAKVGEERFAYTNEVFESLPAARLSQVEHDAALAAVHRLEEAAVVPSASRRNRASDLTPGLLDLDHFRAELGAEQGAVRSRRVLLDGDDSQIVQGSVPHLPPVI